MSLSELRFVRRRTFVDSSAYFALLNDRDASHERALEAVRRLANKRFRLFTSNFVIAETHALLLNRVGRDLAWRFLDQIDQSRGTTIVRVSAQDEARARAIVQQFEDKEYSLTDASCFAIMERLGIPVALTLDRNFVQFGWEVLP